MINIFRTARNTISLITLRCLFITGGNQGNLPAIIFSLFFRIHVYWQKISFLFCRKWLKWIPTPLSFFLVSRKQSKPSLKCNRECLEYCDPIMCPPHCCLSHILQHCTENECGTYCGPTCARQCCSRRPHGGKRGEFSQIGGKRGEFPQIGGKRGEFLQIGGKRGEYLAQRSSWWTDGKKFLK